MLHKRQENLSRGWYWERVSGGGVALNARGSLTVLKCSEGHPYPWQQAFWRCFGGLPEKLIPFFEAREYLHQIYENTGTVLDKYLPFRYTRDWQDNLARIKAELASIAAAQPLSPKKPVQSVRFIQKKRNVVG